MSRTNSSGSSASARIAGGRSMAASASTATLPRDDARRARARSRASSAGARTHRRRPRARDRRRPGARSARTRRGPSRRSAAAGTPSATPGGTPCAAHAAARAPTPRRTPSSRAPRRTGRRPRAAPSRTRTRATVHADSVSATSGVATLYGRFATSFRGERVEPGDVDGEGVAEAEGRRCPVRPAPCAGAPRALRSISTAWTCRTRSARKVVRTPRPGPTSRTTSPALERREAVDDAEHVPVDEEVLPECLLRRDRGSRASSPNARSRRSRRGTPRASSTPTPRTSASVESVWRTCIGSFGRPRTGCGARYGLSVSASRRSYGTTAADSRSSSGLRVRDVPGERDVVAPLERVLEQVGLREAVQDDRSGERLECRPPSRRSPPGCG